MTRASVEESVRIERPVRDVFRAWTSDRRLAEWFAPMAVRPAEVEMRFEVGGRFRISMDLGAGGVHVTEGRFLEIAADERIRMTWRCDAWDDAPSEVEVTFVPDGAATVVRVRHERITSDEARDGQRFGWQACLARLGAVLQRLDEGVNR